MALIFQTLSTILLFLSCISYAPEIHALEASKTANAQLNYATGTLKEVLELAEESQLCVFVHTTSEKNKNCNGLIRPIISDERLVHYLNQNFISYQLNIDDVAYYNFIHIHELKEMPAFFFFSPYGIMVEKVKGISKAGEIQSIAELVLLKNSRDLMDSEFLQSLIDTYNNAYRAGNMLYSLAYGLKSYGMPYNQVVNDYLEQLAPSDLQYDSVKQFIFDFSDNVENQAIDFFLNNINMFYSILNKHHVNNRLTLALHNSIQSAIYKRDRRIYEKALNIIKRYGHICPKTCSFFLKAEYYEGVKDWDNLAKVTIAYINSHPQPDALLLNISAYKMYLYQSDKKHLKHGLKWAERARRLENNYVNNFTTALLLQQLDRNQDALAALAHALNLGKMEGVDTSTAQELWDTLKSRGY